MKLGDPQTTRTVLYVAAAAVVFGVIEMIPSPEGAPAPAAAPPRSAAARPERTETPLSVTSDPFSSPLLAKSVKSPVVGRPSGSFSPILVRDPGAIGPLPDVRGMRPPASGPAGPVAPENGGKTRKEERVVKRTILLSGIVTVGAPVALISIMGAESRTYRIGEQLVPGIKLLALQDSEAVIGIGHQRKVIHLGQVSEL
jgi:hypothetical protein